MTFAGAVFLLRDHFVAPLLCRHYQFFYPSKANDMLRFSPVAWRHINFIGKYEFYNRVSLLDIQEVIKKLIGDSEIDFSAVSQ